MDAKPRAGQPRPDDLGPLELFEDGAGLFRRSFRADAWLYYLSSAPVALATLWIFQRADAMEFSRAGVMQAAALWALAYTVRVWGVAAYLRRLLARMGLPSPSLGWRETAGRAMLELWGRAILLWFWLLAFPFAGPWIYAGAQLLPLAAGTDVDAADRSPSQPGIRVALRLAGGWTTTQWAMLLMVLLVWALLLANFVLTSLSLPALFHALLGMDNPLARTGSAAILLSDPAFWLAMGMASYLAFDPIVKCAFVVAFFRRRSAADGGALRARLADLRRAAAATQPESAEWSAVASVGTAVLLVLLVLLPIPAMARPPASGRAARVVAPVTLAAPPPLTPERLRSAIHIELGQPQYAWRENAGAIHWTWLTSLESALAAALRPIARLFDWLGRMIQRWLDWLLGRLGPERQTAPVLRPSPWRWVAWAAVALLAFLMGWQLLAADRRRRTPIAAAAVAEPAVRSIENASAGEREENEWFALAQSLAAAGELRAAFRAAFLAGLAGLGARRLLTLRRDRTNREYLDEFRRRAAPLGHAAGDDDVALRLRDGIRIFDEVWYGGRIVNGDLLERFIAAQRDLLSHV